MVKFLSNLNRFNSYSSTISSTPEEGEDIANKNYVDNQVSQLSNSLSSKASLLESQVFTGAQVVNTYNLEISSGSLEIDCSLSNRFNCLLTENLNTISLTNNSPNTRIDILFKQDEFGERLVGGWPSIIVWPGGEEPSLASDPEAITIVSLIAWHADLIAGLYIGGLQ